jgi:hypothetical protein
MKRGPKPSGLEAPPPASADVAAIFQVKVSLVGISPRSEGKNSSPRTRPPNKALVAWESCRDRTTGRRMISPCGGLGRSGGVGKDHPRPDSFPMGQGRPILIPWTM